LDIDGILPEIEISKLSLKTFFLGKGIALSQLSKALVATKPVQDGSNHVENDRPSGGEDADSGADNLRQRAAVSRWFYSSRLVPVAKTAFRGGPGAALTLRAQVKTGAKRARGWWFGLGRPVVRIVRIIRVRRGPEHEIGSGTVPLRPAGGIING
jgi:hypothetical protein